ncbi:hypothetical protein A2801_02385 [Candidatus Woesebacteria bacterium RIFCSPHIGHO2_01_FULL_41_10]|uniref:Uncharacterized protein n=1 Tax=Candidatus Woesebacteria bacterium RIFCSPHIGHO2_01_FULL_41_10 TaxID=1802500 RepID=A0A1F7YPH9_9BACT|nr:MAG: hypothetical protein A2801_02385 [Candidatus Woesebacteria bacterium RIFCSPHIGHO2_01_FULL_41_10]
MGNQLNVESRVSGLRIKKASYLLEPEERPFWLMPPMQIVEIHCEGIVKAVLCARVPNGGVTSLVVGQIRPNFLGASVAEWVGENATPLLPLAGLQILYDSSLRTLADVSPLTRDNRPLNIAWVAKFASKPLEDSAPLMAKMYYIALNRRFKPFEELI